MEQFKGVTEYDAIAPAFDFNRAQQHELRFHSNWIVRHFPQEYDRLEKNKAEGTINFDIDDYFRGDKEEYDKFLNHIQGKKCVEIGCGCFPDTKEFWMIQDRSVIDPLANAYKGIEHLHFKKSFFEDFKIYNQKAEQRIDELVGKVDGMIFFQNALDHTDDPLSILDNVSEYAASGCYLIFFTDIWHIVPPNAGHRCITRSAAIMDKLFKGMGFRKVKKRRDYRDATKWLEYGGVFVKE